jgi:hypothetical protein
MIARLSDRYTLRVRIFSANPSNRAITLEVQPKMLRSHSKPRTFRMNAITSEVQSETLRAQYWAIINLKWAVAQSLEIKFAS